MIKANFKAYATYVTDSLNQWDLNQVLQVTGLNLTSAPEVHFSNANTARAIVRQATLASQVVSVGIPNSLLQDPLRIYAHIGVYEGDTFKVVELVEIPVKPRKRPEDYQIQDSDEEIYSFKAIENQLANTLRASDVVDTLDSTDNAAPLSANQGRVLNEKATLQRRSACVLFSPAYKNANGQDFIASSMVPLINCHSYAAVSVASVKILGTASNVGGTRFEISRYGAGFALFSTDPTAISAVAGKVGSFEFTVTE